MAHPTPNAAAAARALPPIIIDIVKRIDATTLSCHHTIAAGRDADPENYDEALLLLPELAATRADMLRFHEIDQLYKDKVRAERAALRQAKKAHPAKPAKPAPAGQGAQ